MSSSATPPVDVAAYPREHITAGILAGGRATRMGGQDKGLVMLAGRPMIAYVIEAMGGQAGRVIINANRNLEAYGRHGVTVVPDREDGFLGPLAGMASMLAASDSEWLLTAPCDSPNVANDFGLRLWQAVVREHADIGVADSGGRLEPVFALIRRSLLGDLEAYLGRGERKIDRWYKSQRMAVADFSDQADMFINVNTPEQRDELAARLGHRGGG